MSFFSRASGVLGMNARNLLYIAKHNSHESKQFADDKIKTKNFLESRGIGVAKLYYTISTHTQLRNFNPNTLPSSFVIKPNKGFGGEGIIVIEQTKGKKFYTVSGEELTWDNIFNHCTAILDGKYAISGLHDKVVIEERLERHECFDGFTEIGLPDVRIIVFNFVPVAAMLRIPTIESGGKANLHVGGIGLGVDLNSGKTTHALYRQKYIRKMPTGAIAKDFQIPDWDEILLAASRIQQTTKIGYLAADLAITKTGIKILEVNARAGLAIQLANRILLKNRLEKVADLKVLTPEEGVEIAKTLFSEKTGHLRQKRKEKDDRSVLSMIEPITLLEEDPQAILAEIDLHGSHNSIDKNLTQKHGHEVFDLVIKEKRYKLPFKIEDRSSKKYKVSLAGKYLRDFLIDPRAQQGELPKIPQAIQKRKEENMIQSLDSRVCSIDTEIKLLSFFRPLNLEEEKEKFWANTLYNPQFTYRPIDLDISAMKKELSKIPVAVTSPLAQLYKAKIKEIKSKLSLIETRGSSEMVEHSGALFGIPTEEEYKKALHDSSTRSDHPQLEDDEKDISTRAVVKRIQEELKSIKLSHWKIKVQEGAVARMQVNKGNTIFVSKTAKFTEADVESLIAHEIKTHIFRFENGKLQKLKIFQRGTANYLETEEGLAVYNEKHLAKAEGNENRSALTVVALHLATSMTFSELFNHLVESLKIEKELAWKVCVKTRRGTTDTRQKFRFTKDMVYYRGYHKVVNFIKANGHGVLKDLYRGKIALDDIKTIRKLELMDPRYWPYEVKSEK